MGKIIYRGRFTSDNEFCLENTIYTRASLLAGFKIKSTHTKKLIQLPSFYEIHTGI